MYKVLLIFKDKDLINRISSLDIWSESDFEISSVCDDYNMALEQFKNDRYELVIAESSEGIAMLRKASSKGLHIRTAFCSHDKNFEAARQGMILGACDYITEPFDKKQIVNMFNRIKNEIEKSEANDIFFAEKLISYFETRSPSFYDYLKDITENELSVSENKSRAAQRLENIEHIVVSDLFAKHPWLDLYINETVIRNEEDIEDNADTAFANSRNRLKMIFSEFCELYPKHSQQIHEVIMTILNYPESDLRQKVISAELHINSTYLSTVFIAQTNVRFVDYMNTVKLKRAAYMLLNTKLEIKEIADRLYYKDISYFSKLFKKKYGIVPSMFRMPSSYNFQI